MICVDQSTGMRTPESLRTLTSLRGSKVRVASSPGPLRERKVPGTHEMYIDERLLD